MVSVSDHSRLLQCCLTLGVVAATIQSSPVQTWLLHWVKQLSLLRCTSGLRSSYPNAIERTHQASGLVLSCEEHGPNFGQAQHEILWTDLPRPTARLWGTYLALCYLHFKADRYCRGSNLRPCVARSSKVVLRRLRVHSCGKIPRVHTYYSPSYWHEHDSSVVTSPSSSSLWSWIRHLSKSIVYLRETTHFMALNT